MIGPAFGPGAFVVESDRFDRTAVSRLRRGSAEWRRLEEEGGRLVPGFGALLGDLFLALFKLNVRVSPPPAGSPFARRIVASLLGSPAYELLRLQTPLDELRAGLGALRVGEAVLEALRSDRALAPGDLLDLWKLAAEEDGVEEADGALEVARDLAGEPAGGSERGEPGAAPAPAAGGEDALGRALRAARLAARAATGRREQKRRHVAEALDRAAPRIERRLRRAAAGALDDLAGLPEAFSAWEAGLGAAAPAEAAARLDLGRRLASEPRLKRLARVFGRVRAEALAVRQRAVSRADAEIHDVARIASLEDLARLVPHELVSLSHPALRRDFHRRLLDLDLLAHRLRGREGRGRGSLVVCLDTSSSMAGEKELWSKAVALAFAEIARRERRRCHVVCFSGGRASLRVFDLNPGRRYEVSLEQTLELAGHFPGGGTDFAPPLDAALGLLSSREHRRSDLVLITDGESEVSPEWRASFLERKRRRGCSLYAILVDRGSVQLSTLRSLADRVARVSDLEADTGALFALRTGRGAA